MIFFVYILPHTFLDFAKIFDIMGKSTYIDTSYTFVHNVEKLKYRYNFPYNFRLASSKIPETCSGVLEIQARGLSQTVLV